MKEIELCPYCGGTPKTKTVGDNKEFIIIKCPNCQTTPLNYGDARSTLGSAKKIWNKKVSEQE